MLNLRTTCYLLILVNCSNSWSEVTLDGSLGRTGALSGPDYQITENLGQRAGSNLFHSFGQFNLQSVESATFSGNPAIQNIISRVTGGSPSSIDGTLRSTIPNANLYFLNPAGIIFGANASLDVQGSFHVSTADYLGMSDGTRFSAVSPGDNQVLTTAAPEAFGFLGDNPNSITLAQAELKVPSGESLSVIGGEIDIEGGELIALGGRIDLASVSSKGEVVRQDNDLSLNGFEQLGNIELTQFAKMDASGEGGGAIYIRGGELTLNESVVISDTFGNKTGKAIDISLPDGKLDLRNGGFITTDTQGAGKGGDLLIEARNINLDREGSEFSTGLITQSSSPGDGGNIKVTTESLEIVNGAGISSVALGYGSGGDVFIEADSVRLSGEGAVDRTVVSTFTQSSGNAGDLTIQSNSLDVHAGATILTTTEGSGTSGIVMVEAEKVRMTGSLSSISATSKDKGNSQDITIKTGSLEVRDGAVINTSVTEGTGKSANLFIEAKDIVLTGNNQSESFTGIFGGSFNSNDAGKVTLITENLEIRNRAQVSTSAFGIGSGGDILVTAGKVSLFGAGGLKTSAVTDSVGDAGTVTIKADNLEVRDRGFVIASTDGAGNAGNLLITARNIKIAGGVLLSLANKDSSGNAGEIIIQADNLEINGTGVSNATESSKDTVTGIATLTAGSGKGGDITIEAGNLLLTGKHSSIVASTEDAGNAGNVTLITDYLELQNETLVSTDTSGSGAGGDILVTARNILLSDSARLLAITGEGDSGDAGKIDITTNNLEVRKESILATYTAGSGDGGDVIVKAGNLLLSGDGADKFTGISAGTGNGDPSDTGDAGDVTIVATHLDIRDGTVIETTTNGAGKGGNISIEGSSVLLSGDGSSRNTGLFSRSSDVGDAGKVSIMANDSLRILDRAFVSVGTTSANGGDIIILADNVFQLSDSFITTSVADGKGNGGNIFIGQQPESESTVLIPNITALNNSQIVAQANEGNGGEINITSDFVFKSQNSIVDASSSEGGIDGTVNINSPETNISGSIVALPETYINASEHLSERCAARSANISSFVVKDRNTIPPGPEDPAFSTFFENDLQSEFDNDMMRNRNRFAVNDPLIKGSAKNYDLRVSHESNSESGCIHWSDQPVLQ